MLLTNEIKKGYKGLEPQLKTIWQKSFGDTAELELFYKKGFSAQDAFVLFDEGRAISNFYLLDSNLLINGKTYKTKYLFAAGTLPSYRKKGYMQKLIEKAAEDLTREGIDFIILKPADEKLRKYYEKQGFVNSFKLKNIKINRTSLKALANGAKGNTVSELTTEKIEKLRSSCYEKYGFAEWNRQFLDYALALNSLQGGKAVYTENAFALFREEDNTAYVKEFCSAGFDSELFAALLEKTSCEKFVISLPLSYPLTCDKTDIEQNGMLLPLTDAAKAANLSALYIQLTLD